MTQSSEISHTLPRRQANREVDEFAVLIVVGSGANVASLAKGRVVVLGQGVEIGRRPPVVPNRNNLVLADRTVSALHARVSRQEDDSYTLVDLESTNGTVVNGRSIVAEVPLTEGALIFLGSQVMVFRRVTSTQLAALETDRATPFLPERTLSPALAVVCDKLRKLAPSETEILLLGETGVGKEVMASAIHAASGRKGQLLAINSAALPRELVESELFGYERGAHSTAKARKAGLIEAAQGGTLFLDELGEMPLDVQSKLLRFLQDRTYLPIGSTVPRTGNVRIIAASSRISAPAAAPAIQEALMGRLGAHPIEIPPLRSRIEDVGMLVRYFLNAAGCDRALEPDVFQALCLYEWPHNVRELQKVIAEAELLSRDSEQITFDHLPRSIVDEVERRANELPALPEDDEERPSNPGVPFLGPQAGGRFVWQETKRRPMPNADQLRELLKEYQGSVSAVARHLDRHWAVVWRNLRKHGIEADDYRPPRPPGGPVLPRQWPPLYRTQAPFPGPPAAAPPPPGSEGIPSPIEGTPSPTPQSTPATASTPPDKETAREDADDDALDEGDDGPTLG